MPEIGHDKRNYLYIFYCALAISCNFHYTLGYAGFLAFRILKK